MRFGPFAMRLTGETWHVTGRGVVHGAVLDEDAQVDALRSELVGLNVVGVGKIIAVETFAVARLSKGMPIGLLVAATRKEP